MKRIAPFCMLALLAATAPLSAGIIANGDFSFGNTGFSSQYAYAAGNCYPPAVYDIVTNPQSCHGSWASFGDHTSGTGNMMVVNGAEVTGVEVWQQTVAVVPDTTYYFSTWIASTYPVSPAELAFSINGAQLGSVFTVTNTVGQWQQFYASWFSGGNTSASLAIVNQNTAFTGNDFALDDIALGTSAPGVPEPSAFVLIGIGSLAIIIGKMRRPHRSKSR